MSINLTRRACLQALLLLPVICRAAPLRPDPRRVVAINWAAAETLLSIGIAPLAISDSGYFRRRIVRPRLPDNMIDVGPFWEPNLELLRALRPSLIISDLLPSALMQRMAAIAPLEVVTPFQRQEDLWDGLRGWTREIGERLGTAEAAARWLRQAAAEMAACQQRLRQVAGTQALVMVLDQDGKHATIYGQRSLAGSVLEHLGLINAWQQPVNAVGTARVGIEQLALLPCEALFYTELPTTMTRLTRSRQPDGLWRRLPLVQAGRSYPMPHFFPFGSLATALTLAGRIADAIGEPA